MTTTVAPPDLDLGHGHALTWVQWTPDRQLNPKCRDLPDVARWGAIVSHPADTESGRCVGGYITLEQGPEFASLMGDRPVWRIEADDPLTLSPSLACRWCGDHGWIREGAWVPA